MKNDNTLSEKEAEKKLQELASKGLAVVERRHYYKTRHRVTSICALDIDNDGDQEIIFGGADGRLTVLSQEYEIRWTRVVGNKMPVTAVALLPHRENTRVTFFIAVGSASGSLYLYNKDGQMLQRKDGQIIYVKKNLSDVYPLNLDADLSNTTDQTEIPPLFTCAQAINQISITPDENDIILTSEDHHIYALSHVSGEQIWQYSPEHSWARCIVARDINNDGLPEILMSTAHRGIYLLDHTGQQQKNLLLEHPVRALCVEDIDDDGIAEILIATDKHDLKVLNPDLQVLWSRDSFTNRVRALHVVDLNKDGKRQIIAGGDDQYLSILDARGELLWRHFLGARITCMCANDIDGDGTQEIIVGTDDECIYVLRVNLTKISDGLHQQLQAAREFFTEPARDLPTGLIPSERELLKTLAYRGREKPISLEQAEEPLQQKRFLEALTAFLQLEQQKIEILWSRETACETKLLCFGDVLGDLIVGTTDGKFQAYDAAGKDLWNYPLDDHILSAQPGCFQNPEREDILVCSTNHQIYLIGYPCTDTGGEKPQPTILKQYPMQDPLICSLAIKAGFRSIEVLLGSENQKIYVYRHGLDDTPEQIAIKQGVRIIQFYSPPQQRHNAPDILVARTDQYVAAYKYASQEQLWEYQTYNHVRSLTVKDIDGDGHNEVIIGSEDRNIHVITDQGQLKWRYYLPYSVLSTHVADVNQDGALEVLAGCADGYLYVFNKEGDLLWKYHVDERITNIASRERKNGHVVEIALGTENRVELLQVINARYLQDKIESCWQSLLQERSEIQVVEELLQNNTDSIIHVFALKKAECLISRDDCFLDLKCLDLFLKDSSVEVRKTLISLLARYYHRNPLEIRQRLDKLSKDQEREVKLALIEQIDQIIQYDWKAGFEYLIHFSDNTDRFIRRGVIRKLYRLIEDRNNSSWDHIFQLLLQGARYQKSAWVRQEAARALAHFLYYQPLEILKALYFFIIKGVDDEVLLLISHYATFPAVHETLKALVMLQKDDLNTENAPSRLNAAVQALASRDIRGSKFGEETWLVFKELRELFSMSTLEMVALYRCQLKNHQPDPTNQHFNTARLVFESIPNFTRLLKIYLLRQNVNDRISSLQEANRAIDRLTHFMNHEYQTALEDESLTKLPDYRFFQLLFKQWRDMLQTRLNDLLGKPKLKTELLTKVTRYEQFITVLLSVQNIGRSTAYSVRVALLHSEDFTVIVPAVAQTDILFWQETLRAEFTLKFGVYRENATLHFEITYDDGESEFCKKIITEHLALRLMEEREYEFIPNPYSTGAPVIDNSMFFGRERDVAKLKTELALNTAQRIIVLHGLRRSGKTSLLRHLASNDILENCIAIYLDLQKMTHEMTMGSLFFSIGYEIQRTIQRKTQITLPLPEKSVFKDDPTFTFDHFLDEVESQLSAHRIALLIDEFEILQEQARDGYLPPTLFRYLRGLMQGRRINFLLAGTHRLEQLTRDYWAVFYNFVLPHPLSKISREGATSLITVPTRPHLTYDQFAIEKIHQLTGDQPFLLNNFCRLLVDHCNDLRKTYVTLYDVNALLTSAVTINSIPFNSLWQQVPLEEQSVMAIIAQASYEHPFTFTEIENLSKTEHIPYGQGQLRDVLGSLTQQDLLENVLIEEDAEQMRYRIPMGLLRIWINQEQPLSTLKLRLKGHHR